MANVVTLPANNFQGQAVGGFFNNLVASQLQRAQQRQSGQQFGQAFGPQFSGITNPNIQQLIAQRQLQNTKQQPGFTLDRTRFTAEGKPIVSVGPKKLSPSEERAKLKLGLERIIVDENAPEAKKRQAEARLKSISPPTVRLDLNRQSRQDRIRELKTFIDILSKQADDILNPDQQKAQERRDRFTKELEDLIKEVGTASQTKKTARKKAKPNERISAIDATTGQSVTIPADQFDAAVKAGVIRAK